MMDARSPSLLSLFPLPNFPGKLISETEKNIREMWVSRRSK